MSSFWRWGRLLELSEDEASITGPVPTGIRRVVDGLGVGDVGNVVLRDRKHLSQDGLIIVVVGVSKETGQVTSGRGADFPRVCLCARE